VSQFYVDGSRLFFSYEKNRTISQFPGAIRDPGTEYVPRMMHRRTKTPRGYTDSPIVKINEPIKRSSFDSCPEFKSQEKETVLKVRATVLGIDVSRSLETPRGHKRKKLHELFFKSIPWIIFNIWIFRRFQNFSAFSMSSFIEFDLGRKSWRVTRERRKERSHCFNECNYPATIRRPQLF